jgi:hypothetical protein
MFARTKLACVSKELFSLNLKGCFDFLFPTWLGGKKVVNPAGCTSKQKIKKAKPRKKAVANYACIYEHKDLFRAD